MSRPNVSWLVSLTISIVAVACGPETRDDCDPAVDPNQCIDPDAPCSPGTVTECYSGPIQSLDLGACVAGHRTCTTGGTWGLCVGEVIPHQEVCGNGVDENCSGEADENVDFDNDGYTTCAGDCCDSSECASPELVNPGAFEALGNGVDDDCDTVADNALASCDAGILSNTGDDMDFARTIDLCQMTTESAIQWGVISSKLTKADGTGVPAIKAKAVREQFGTAMPPQGGAKVAILSTGHAADSNDMNPEFHSFASAAMGTQSGFPADFIDANGGMLPNAPGCPNPSATNAFDPVMLTLRIRVPSNARSFSLSTNFFSAEYPEYTCTVYNDFFVVLLDSIYAGDPANPADKNLAFYTAPDTNRYPVGVNLAYGNTGLFRECMNGTAGCSGSYSFQHTACTSTAQLAGTGFDVVTGSCSPGAVMGGGTGWLTTSGNVVGGEIITLRIAIWDTSDSALDSLAIIDNFKWSVDSANPGTVID